MAKRHFALRYPRLIESTKYASDITDEKAQMDMIQALEATICQTLGISQEEMFKMFVARRLYFKPRNTKVLVYVTD